MNLKKKKKKNTLIIMSNTHGYMTIGKPPAENQSSN